MALKLYNTLTRQKEVFTPFSPEGPVTIYACGPTVYGPAHLGNLRTYVFNDVLRRTLEYTGREVKQVMNITDVDDKTIKGSREAGQPLGEFTRAHEAVFLRDLERLNIKRPSALPHATEYVPQMIAMIERLLAQGAAYPTDDGVYFKLSTKTDYGKLSGRPAAAEGDFALWKFAKPEDGDVAWDAPFGRGRPGWHIECSAMIDATLGRTIDIHTGATDLIFPHHENEIAQSEAASGAPLAHFWLHGGFLNFESEKMSKSIGNTLTLDALAAQGISPLAYRLWLLQAHYRSPLNFNLEAVGAAQTAYERLTTWASDAGEPGTINPAWQTKFTEALEDDLNTPQAVATLWDLLRDDTLTLADKKATVLDFDRVLGLNLDSIQAVDIPPELTQLANERELARQAKDWAKADELRAKIADLGYTVDDTADGPRLRRDLSTG